MTTILKQYKQDLIHLKGEYQNTIKLNKEIAFGVEIEFAGIELKDIFKFINEKINKIDNNSAFEYRIWNIINEITVEETKNGKKLGGEIVSPILHNNEKSWKSLEKITECFKFPGFYFSDRCSFHIHFGEKYFSHFKNEMSSEELCAYKFILNLFKIWLVFEDIIYKTCYGSKSQERKKIIDYAVPIGQIIYERIYSMNDEEQIMQFVKEYSGEKAFGLNLKNLKYNSKKTIEIRCPNAMETTFLMQNTIRFLSRILQYCDSDTFDKEKIDYYIKQYRPMNIIDFREEKFEKAKTLADMIYDNELDKMYFLKQYLKCFSEEEFIGAPQNRI